jgi:phage anti-repressor protein
VCNFPGVRIPEVQGIFLTSKIKNNIVMKKTWIPVTALVAGSVALIALWAFKGKATRIKNDMVENGIKTAKCCVNHKVKQEGCVFKTVLGLENFDKTQLVKNKELVDAALSKGLEWIVSAQSAGGGWGSGDHSRQDIRDPHLVKADPASTSLMGMALLRNENDNTKGKYTANFNKAVEYLLKAVEQAPVNAFNITDITNTQPQVKLGRNIDVILTAQFFTNYLQQCQLEDDHKVRVETALQKCITMMQRSQDTDGGWKDGGWAPVLQSALANNALETARDAGYKVDDAVLEKSQQYQKNNFDTKTNNAVTGKAAGVLLYSISGSARASAKESKLAEVSIAKAKKEGRLTDTAAVNKQNLVVAGYSAVEAEKFAAAYEVRKAASSRAQDKEVLRGFGNNGGEEFLSFLMTGESLIMSQDNSWKKWYDETSARLLQIQNNDGSWNGHHCITSPVFCTATCLLILSIDKDIDFLIKVK